MSANLIADNSFAQFDQAENRSTIIDPITETRTDGTQVLQKDALLHISTGTKIRVNTTKGWGGFIQWKDGSTTWNTLKNLKDYYPVQMAGFAVENRISEEPDFAW